MTYQPPATPLPAPRRIRSSPVIWVAVGLGGVGLGLLLASFFLPWFEITLRTSTSRSTPEPVYLYLVNGPALGPSTVPRLGSGFLLGPVAVIGLLLVAAATRGRVNGVARLGAGLVSLVTLGYVLAFLPVLDDYADRVVPGGTTARGPTVTWGVDLGFFLGVAGIVLMGLAAAFVITRAVDPAPAPAPGLAPAPGPVFPGAPVGYPPPGLAAPPTSGPPATGRAGI